MVKAKRSHAATRKRRIDRLLRHLGVHPCHSEHNHMAAMHYAWAYREVERLLKLEGCKSA